MSNSSDSESFKSLPDGDDTKSIEDEEPSNSEPVDGANLRRTKFSRAEKKARRMLIKQGSKPLPNVSRIVMRQAHMLFIIEDAEVYRSPKSDTFIVFGEVKIEDLSKQQEQVMEFNQVKAAASLTNSPALSGLYPKKPTIGDVEDDEVVDDTGVDLKDIELVMSQASTTRARAVRALKENDNDIVNAILALTM